MDELGAHSHLLWQTAGEDVCIRFISLPSSQASRAGVVAAKCCDDDVRGCRLHQQPSRGGEVLSEAPAGDRVHAGLGIGKARERRSGAPTAACQQQRAFHVAAAGRVCLHRRHRGQERQESQEHAARKSEGKRRAITLERVTVEPACKSH